MAENCLEVLAEEADLLTGCLCNSKGAPGATSFQFIRADPCCSQKQSQSVGTGDFHL